jgi:hypothetical protein
MKTVIVTACGAKKSPIPMPAYKFYKSSRIRAVFNRRGDSDMFILSAEYGLIDACKVIRPYERLMDEQRSNELTPSVAKKLLDYSNVIYFRGGARRTYFSCIKASCRKAKKTLVAFGYANMGGINDLPKILKLLQERELDALADIKHSEVFLYESGKNIC